MIELEFFRFAFVKKNIKQYTLIAEEKANKIKEETNKIIYASKIKQLITEVLQKSDKFK